MATVTNSLTTSADGLAKLEKHEGSIDGLYDDPSGYCTFGVGHLVHPTDKWSCFLLAAARSDDTWKGKIQKTLGVEYLPRAASGWSDLDKLKEKAIELGIDTVGTKKFAKKADKLGEGEKKTAKGIAEAAVRDEAAYLARTVRDVLKADVATFEKAVNDSITGVALKQEEFDALVSLAFNIGASNFKSSTLVRKINENKYRNGTDTGARDKAIDEIAKAFGAWNKSGGKVLSGLTKRREAEAGMFLTGAKEENNLLKAKGKAKP